MTRAERHRELRAKKAAEAQVNVSPYGMNRRWRRLTARELRRHPQFKKTEEGIVVPAE